VTKYEAIECDKNIPANVFITSIEKSSFHWHFEYELILVLKGSIQVTTGPNISVLQAREVILLNSKTVHEIRKTGDHNICLFIQMSQALFADVLDENRSYHFYLNSRGDGIYRNEAIWRFINLASRIGIESNKKDGVAWHRLRALVYTLVADCFEYLPFIIQQHSFHGVQKDLPEKVMGIINYVHDNYRNLSVFEDVTREFGVSDKTLYRLLKNNCGLTLHELVTNCKIDAAKSMLKNTDKNMQFIADDCGFGSEVTFFRCFKKCVGLTPNEYRAKGLSIDKDPEIKGYMGFNKSEALRLLENLYRETDRCGARKK